MGDVCTYDTTEECEECDLICPLYYSRVLALLLCHADSGGSVGGGFGSFCIVAQSMGFFWLALFMRRLRLVACWRSIALRVAHAFPCSRYRVADDATATVCCIDRARDGWSSYCNKLFQLFPPCFAHGPVCPTTLETTRTAACHNNCNFCAAAAGRMCMNHPLSIVYPFMTALPSWVLNTRNLRHI